MQPSKCRATRRLLRDQPDINNHVAVTPSLDRAAHRAVGTGAVVHDQTSSTRDVLATRGSVLVASLGDACDLGPASTAERLGADGGDAGLVTEGGEVSDALCSLVLLLLHKERVLASSIVYEDSRGTWLEDGMKGSNIVKEEDLRKQEYCRASRPCNLPRHGLVGRWSLAERRRRRQQSGRRQQRGWR